METSIVVPSGEMAIALDVKPTETATRRTKPACVLQEMSWTHMGPRMGQQRLRPTNGAALADRFESDRVHPVSPIIMSIAHHSKATVNRRRARVKLR